MPQNAWRYCCEHCSNRIEKKKDLVEVNGKKLHKDCEPHYHPQPLPPSDD